MLVKTAIFQFVCPKCGFTDGRINRGVGHDVTNIVTAMSSFPKCPACKVVMKVDKVVCRMWKLDSEFGDLLYGVWSCKTHFHRDFYPTPLKNTIEKRYADGYFESEFTAVYKTIAEKGYPWKCPFCDNYLRYRDEREERGDFIHELII